MANTDLESKNEKHQKIYKQLSDQMKEGLLLMKQDLKFQDKKVISNKEKLHPKEDSGKAV